MSAWTVIAHTEVGASGVSQIQFQNISQNYDDLVIKLSLRTNSSNFYEDIDMTFNGESARAWRSLYYVPTSVASSNSTSFNIVAQAPGTSATSSTFNNAEIYIPNYKSTAVKSMSSDSVLESNSSTNYALLIAANTITNGTAVNEITLFCAFNAFNFVQYSSATLYGITKGSSGGVTVS
jgi:hypothetical protein